MKRSLGTLLARRLPSLSRGRATAAGLEFLVALLDAEQRIAALARAGEERAVPADLGSLVAPRLPKFLAGWNPEVGSSWLLFA